jgi:site-specific DNA-methyltransferase (adenine-specific)
MKTHKQDNLTIHNADCMEVMSQYEDNYFDLAAVDPPYGIGESGGKFRDRKGGGHRVLPKKEWDNETPNKEYFDELQRVSKHQIIWGGNYFTDKIPASRCWLYWEKRMGGDFSDGELAWTSFNKVLKQFTLCNKMGGKIHPTQKPVKLYNWIYKNYAQEGQKILDTHLGSGSNAISAHYAKMGEFVGCELDEDYFKASIERIYKETRQQELF